MFKYVRYTRAGVKGATIANMFTGNKRFVVPIYQRGYSWKPQQVEQFLEDLEEVNGEQTEEHFYGYILTTPAKQQATQIIDGQQRVTTATLFLVCARNFYHTHGKEELVKTIETHIYSTINGVDCDRTKPILVLGIVNNSLFEDVLDKRGIEEELISSHSKKDESNKALTKAYKTIQKWFNEECGPNDTKKIQELVHTLLTRFTIIEQECNDEMEAQRVFDLVNNRGMRLKDPDLIKNYLFGVIASSKNANVDDDEGDGEIKRYDQIWKEMRENVTNTQTDYDLDNFFAHYIVAIKKLELASSKKTYGRFGDMVKVRAITKAEETSATRAEDAEAAKAVIQELRTWSDVMYKLRNPTSVKEFKKYVDLVHYLKKIKEIKAKLVYMPIFAGYDKYWGSGEYLLFEKLVVLCFKTHVRLKGALGERDGVIKSVMQEITRAINEGEEFKQIIERVVEHKKYRTDDYVKSRLEEFAGGSEIALALLEEAEYAHSGHRSGGDVTLEHIMPRTIDQKWIDYIIKHENLKGSVVDTTKKAGELHDKYLDRLGNQTLLTKTENPSLSNELFEIKVKVYKKNKYTITHKISADEPWTMSRIEDRQKMLAEYIVGELDIRKIDES